MTEQAGNQTAVDVSDVLLDPNVQQSLNTVLEKLPQLAKLMTAMTKDEETMASLVTVIENLPQMAKLLYLVGRVYQAAEDVVTDGDSLDGAAQMLKKYSEPVVQVAHKGLHAYHEAKVRAEHDTTNYSVFGLLKLLKDPNVQKGLRFATAMLDVLGEDGKPTGQHA